MSAYASVRPLALLAFVGGALPSSGLWAAGGRGLGHRWVSWPSAYSVTLCVTCSAVMWTCGTWWPLMKPYYLVRNAALLLSGVGQARGLPLVLDAVDRYDAAADVALPSRGWAWASCSSVLVAGYFVTVDPGTNFYAGLMPCVVRALHVSLFLCTGVALWRRFLGLASLTRATSNPDLVVELHRHLVVVTRFLNTAFGYHLAISVITVTVEFLQDIFLAVYGGKKFHTMYFNSIHVVTLIVIASIGERISSANQEIIHQVKNIKLCELDINAQRKVQNFMVHLCTTPVNVYAGGFSVVNKAMLVSILTALTTYFIAMIQCGEELKKYGFGS